MNEIVIDRWETGGSLWERIAGTRETRKSGAFYGYALTLIALGIGWLLREHYLIHASEGVGYWLGITGGSLMLLLLLYPLRKRFRALRFLGTTAAWFKAHMIIGVFAPVLVLYHSNFHLGSFNSQVALWCMLAVAISGVIGRYIYTRIHNGLYGRKTSLQQLRQHLADSLEQGRGFGRLMPKFSARLKAVVEEVQGDSITGTLGLRASLWWMLRRYLIWWSLHRVAMRELRARSLTSERLARDFPRLKKATSAYIRRFVRLAGRVARFTVYERLFSFWHVLHLPLFLMMVISALVHVLAVHMY